MDIKILHSWLREYLDTNATPEKIAECLSLCGPSVEKVEKKGKDSIYSIEVTTNRVDSASIMGMAREAAAILPTFGIKARFVAPKKTKTKPRNKYHLDIKANEHLTKRIMAAVLENIEDIKTPDWMRERLETSGVRSLNLIVDITNYVMLEIGHPTHVFDYEAIKNGSLVFRESDKGEKIVSFDGKSHTLPGGDIVIDNGEGNIIDLPGIIGTKNSVVSKSSKRVVFFLDNNDPVKIRKTSMSLAIRTYAASLNEKGVDPELGSLAFSRGIELFQSLGKAKLASRIYDIYPTPYKAKYVEVKHAFIEKRLGIEIKKDEIKKILASLGFVVVLKGNTYSIEVPSYRSQDIAIPEDIVEEVARIHGYHNLPSLSLTGAIPPSTVSTFEFEKKLKETLTALGGVEVYTLSLVPKESAPSNAIKLRNPLGNDTEYLRTSLMPSLIAASRSNSFEKDPLHLFEMANVYNRRKSDLPEERLMLAGVFANTNFRKAKGAIQALLEKLHINHSFSQEDLKGYLPSHGLKVMSQAKSIGTLGFAEAQNDLIYYEFEVSKLQSSSLEIPAYSPIPRYPPQIEDITIKFPPRTKIGEVLSEINKSSQYIKKGELTNIYKDSHTFRVQYLHPEKTLTNEEVDALRKKIIDRVQQKFGGTIKN